jgi:hypothetical protein
MRLRTLCVLALALGAGYLMLGRGHAPDVDPLVSASIPAADSKDFTVSNMENGAACILTRGKAITNRSRELRASVECEAVWPGLAHARNWTDNGDGTVAVTDDGGEAILTLGLGDGVEFESLEPANAVLAVNTIG